MHTRLQNANPQKESDEDIRRQTGDACPVQDGQCDKRRSAECQRVDGEIRRVEGGDDYDCAKVIYDRQRQQKQFQRRGNPVAEEREDAQGEGDVGGGRDRPAAQCWEVGRVDGRVDERRGDDAADRGDHRQRGFREARQFALKGLPFDL